MPAASRILRGSICSVTDTPNAGPSPTALVDITINGQRTRRGITKNEYRLF